MGLSIFFVVVLGILGLIHDKRYGCLLVIAAVVILLLLIGKIVY